MKGRPVDAFESECTEWPPWSPLVSIGVIAITAVISLALRRALIVPSAAVLYVLLASLPFVLDAADVVAPARLKLPIWLFPVPTLVGATLLVWHPVDNDFAAFFFVFVTATTVMRADDHLPVAVGVGIGSAGLMASAEVFGPYRVSAPWIVGIVFAWFGGFVLRKLVRALQDLKRAQADLAERAAVDERRRIAREIHDVIAHSLSVTLLHVSGARMGLERIGHDQPSRRLTEAIDALREAEGHGRSSLGNIKRSVGLLGPDKGASTPLPEARDLRGLIRDFRSAGVNVELRMADGAFDDLAPASALNLYRIIQESLTNVVKHAPGAEAAVQLAITEDQVRLVVRNGASTNGAPRLGAPSSGLGVPGMTERAALMGGSLAAGPDCDGWMVAVTVPRDETAQVVQ